LAKVARTMVGAGDPDWAGQLATAAEQIARSITDPVRQAQALAEVTRAMAGAGDPDRAEQIARGITTPHLQAQALAQVAEVVGFPHGCRLLGEAFAVGSWLT